MERPDPCAGGGGRDRGRDRTWPRPFYMTSRALALPLGEAMQHAQHAIELIPHRGDLVRVQVAPGFGHVQACLDLRRAARGDAIPSPSESDSASTTRGRPLHPRRPTP